MSTSLPSYVSLTRQGFSEAREPAVMRTTMETGPAKVLKVKSRVMVRRAVMLYVASKADYQSFMTWYQTTLNYGADWFTFTDPVTGSSATGRFADTSLGAAQPVANVRGGWKIPATIETWSA